MTSLTAIFGSSQNSGGDTEKLLELYWNRAELKKEFARLRDQTFQLKDQIKAQQGHTARAEQKLAHLENLLLDPEWVYNVVVFYQLRALDERCRAKLAGFAEQLKQQREKRQHSRLLEEWNLKRQAEAEAVEAKIADVRLQAQMLEDQLQAERHRYSMMGGFMRFLRKRAIARQLDSIAGDIAAAQQQESVLQSELTEIRHRQPPDTQGLNIASKRSINLMILSFAQQLYLHFEDDNLAALAKESGEKSVGAINYGGKPECESLLHTIAERSESMAKAGADAEVLKQRAKLLGEQAKFPSNDEAVPSSDSLPVVYDIDANGGVRKHSTNLLAENYWDLATILSR